VAVALRVAVVVAVAVGVAVAVLVAVAVGVAVRVEVGVGVGLFFFFFAVPVTLTLADDVPLVASLVIAIFAEKPVPASLGANSTVTVASPCGSISVAPWPDTMWKNSLPAAGATVTDRAAPPLSVMTKDLVSVAAPLDRLTLPKSSVVGVTSSLLTEASRRALSMPTASCARALNENENKISQAKMNEAIDAARAMREDASNEPPRPIVKNPPEMLRARTATIAKSSSYFEATELCIETIHILAVEACRGVAEVKRRFRSRPRFGYDNTRAR